MANNSSWHKSVVLTPKEGVIMEEIIAVNNCANISQLLKKIVYGKPITIQSEQTMNDNPIVAKALEKTQSVNLQELCRKIADGQLAIIIK